MMIERILQHMVLRNFLREDRKENASGYASYYINLGVSSHNLECGRERLLVGVRQIGGNKASTCDGDDIDHESDYEQNNISRPPLSRLPTPKPVASSKRVVSDLAITLDESDDEAMYVLQKSASKNIPLKQCKPRAELVRTLDDDSGPADGLTAVGGGSFSKYSLQGEDARPSLTAHQRTALQKWLFDYRKRWDNYWNYLNNTSGNK